MRERYEGVREPLTARDSCQSLSVRPARYHAGVEGKPSPMSRAVMAALGGERFEAESDLVLLLGVLAMHPRGVSARELRTGLRRRKQDLGRELKLYADAGLIEPKKRIERGGGSLWRITLLGRRLLRRESNTIRIPRVSP